MGWLTMTRMAMGGHETPKAYLDAQLTYERKAEGDTPFQGLRVLKSVYSGSTYYAAAERYDENGKRIYVTAIWSAGIRAPAMATSSAIRTWTRTWVPAKRAARGASSRS